ncbi:MAG TPA: hypothetical protein VF784_02770 [Anaerolineales bacterium]
MPSTQEAVNVADPSAEPPTSYRQQIVLLRNPKGWLRLLGYLSLVYFLTVLFLGFIFMAMLLPLTLAFARLAVIFTPAYHLAGRIMGVKGLPARLAIPPTWLTIYSIVWVLFQLGIAAILFRLLFFVGFCNQNLICISSHLLLK